MPAIAVNQRNQVSSLCSHIISRIRSLRGRRLGGVAEDELPADFLDTPESRPAGDASNASDGEQAANSSPGGSDEPASASAEPQDPG